MSAYDAMWTDLLLRLEELPPWYIFFESIFFVLYWLGDTEDTGRLLSWLPVLDELFFVWIRIASDGFEEPATRLEQLAPRLKDASTLWLCFLYPTAFTTSLLGPVAVGNGFGMPPLEPRWDELLSWSSFVSPCWFRDFLDLRSTIRKPSISDILR